MMNNVGGYSKRKHQEPNMPPLPPPQLNELQHDINSEVARLKDAELDAIAAYAPPAVRRSTVPHEEPVIKHVTQFAELPTKEIDEVLVAAKEEIAALEQNAQMVRDLYIRATDRISADIRRLREGVRLSMATMQQLRDHCSQLNDAAIASTEQPAVHAADEKIS